MREIRDVIENDVDGVLRELIARAASLALGTAGELGEPHVSYVPYACAGGAIVFVVSRLAAHARHLAARETVSGLIVGPAAADAYSSARLTTMGRARSLSAGTAAAEGAWTALERRHGATVALLRTLTDFDAYAHEPEHGRLVLGFARAYDVAGATLSAAIHAAASA